MEVNEALAAAFVRRQGDAVERARLDYLLTGVPPRPAVVAALLAGQRPDGGWPPFWAPVAGSLDATCFRLAQADQLGLGAREAAMARAAAFLAGRQRPDGGFEEEASLAPVAPPWARPGDNAACLYLTANCGYWLAVVDGPADAVARSADLLQGRLAADGALPTFAHAHWLAAGLWWRIGRREPAERALGHLGALLPDLDAGNLAWLAVALVSAGLPTKHPLLRRAMAMLTGRQRPDGRWESEDGPARDVHTTLEVLRALRACT